MQPLAAAVRRPGGDAAGRALRPDGRGAVHPRPQARDRARDARVGGAAGRARITLGTPIGEAEVLALETNQMRTLGASYAALGMLGWVILTAGDGAMRVLGVRAFACWSAMQQLSLLLSPPSGSILKSFLWLCVQIVVLGMTSSILMEERRKAQKDAAARREATGRGTGPAR